MPVMPGGFEIDMPMGAHVLSIHTQDQKPVLYAEVDEFETVKIKRQFWAEWTGQPTSVPPMMNYLGSLTGLAVKSPAGMAAGLVTHYYTE